MSRPAKRSREPYLDLDKSTGRYRVVYYDERGQRRFHRTGFAGSDYHAANKYLYEKFLCPDHKPQFGSGDPDQVRIVDALNFYAQAKEEEARRKPTLNLKALGFAIRNLRNFANAKGVRVVADWDEVVTTAKFVEWRTKQGVSTSTARTELVFLRAALHYCQKKGNLSRVPRIELPFRPEHPHPRHLTRAEFALLMWGALGWDGDGVRRYQPHYALARFLLVGAFTGTRTNRMLRLQFVENLKGGWVDLGKGKLHRRGKHEPETNKRAPSVALPPLPKGPRGNKLRAHLERWSRRSRTHVIEGRFDQSITIDAIQKHLNLVCDRMGINCANTPRAERVTPHTLRHTFATWGLESGLPCGLIGKYMGATEAMVERVYSHSSEESERATASAIGSGFAKTQPAPSWHSSGTITHKNP
jgi:integrase